MIIPPVIVLVRPQMGENIGAAARAMMNFGLCELRLVAPRDGWPNPKAMEMSAHATGILEHATVHGTLAEALADVQEAWAATARRRDLSTLNVLPEEMAARTLRPKLRSALVFGPENNGLSNEDVALCTGVVSIPTHPANPSLNIAQAVVVLASTWYRCSVGACDQTAGLPHEEDVVASQQEVQALFDHLDQALDARGFYKVPQARTRIQQQIRVMWSRMAMSAQEVRIWQGVLRTLQRPEKLS